MPSIRLLLKVPVGATALMTAGLALANPATPPPAALASPISSSLSSVLQITFALGIVLLAIFATAWLLRRLGAGQLGQAGHIRLISGVAVGPKERVVVVEVQDTWLVLGVTAVEISHLQTMSKPPEKVASTPVSVTFAERLAQVIRRQNKPAASTPDEATP